MSQYDAALSIVRSLLGNRLTYPRRQARDRHYSPTDRLNLTGRPVYSVESVTDHSGAEVPYEVSGSGVVVLSRYRTVVLGAQPCSPFENYLEVEYTYGLSQLPTAVSRAVEVLAAEMQASVDGKPCRLPDRVTSVNRQGVSWTLIDPQDFLLDGRTGLYEVDLVLSAYSGGSRARARARTFSPEFRPPIRLWDRVAT